jgi:integral membrane sensor domain MASE1
VLSARLGLTLSPVNGFATLVWPPTGIALAALVVRGVRLWPAVMLGALVANVWTGASFWVATGIGIGNTLEAIAGAALLTRVGRIHRGLDRLADALALVLLAAGLSTTISATIGVGVLRWAGIVAPDHVAETWRAWWVGDVLGDLVVAPVLLTWRTVGRLTLSAGRTVEGLSLVVAAVTLSCFVFLVGPSVDPTPFHQATVLFPVLIWAALRFGPPGAAGTLFLISVFAVWGTLGGHGPFGGGRRARHLLNQPPEQLGPQARKHGEFVARCARRIDSLLGNVLDAATIRTGHLSLIRERQDLGALIQEAVDTFEPLAEEKSQVLRVEVPPLLPVDGDRERLLQVLANLLGNAVKFAPQNGTIIARAEVEDAWVRCSVSDDGPGIQAAEVGRVFEPYWTGGSSGGTGLGLSIVRGIVEAHGGSTFVESEPGMGTTIGFRLPLVPGALAAPGLLVPRILSR